MYRTVPRDGSKEDEKAGPGEGGNPQPPTTVATTVTTVAEDNGFTTFLGIPVNSHVLLSGYYNRSLRQRLDTVSFGVTFVLRGAPKKRLSLIDKALREAEGAGKQ